MQEQMQRQQQESARLLSESEAEVRRLRKALDEAVASKEALREMAAMELGARQRAAEEAEERHLAQERRLLTEIDRERMSRPLRGRCAPRAVTWAFSTAVIQRPWHSLQQSTRFAIQKLNRSRGKSQ
jgi:hypothetical protein